VDVTTPDDMVLTIAEEIQRYLTEHPRAGDTVDGVRAWWVGHRRHQASRAIVLQALTRLVERGVVRSRTLPDGTVVYSSAVATPESGAPDSTNPDKERS
jgi:hypothetical protein